MNSNSITPESPLKMDVRSLIETPIHPGFSGFILALIVSIWGHKLLENYIAWSLTLLLGCSVLSLTFSHYILRPKLIELQRIADSKRIPFPAAPILRIHTILQFISAVLSLLVPGAILLCIEEKGDFAFALLMTFAIFESIMLLTIIGYDSLKKWTTNTRWCDKVRVNGVEHEIWVSEIPAK